MFLVVCVAVGLGIGWAAYEYQEVKLVAPIQGNELGQKADEKEALIYNAVADQQSQVAETAGADGPSQLDYQHQQIKVRDARLSNHFDTSNTKSNSSRAGGGAARPGPHSDQGAGPRDQDQVQLQ